MDYDKKYTPMFESPKGNSEDITGRLTPTNTGRYERSDENAFYVGGTKFSKPLEKDYKGNIITTEQGEENRRYKIFERTIDGCVVALAIAASFLTITGAKITWDYYTKKDYNTRQIIEPFKNQVENEGRYEFVVPEEIRKIQEEQIENIKRSQEGLFK
jgi:hypothetical protein